jgi:hypothetical protein
MKKLLLGSLVALFACVSTVRADIIGLQSFSGGFGATSGSDQLYGWRFDALSAINVTSLGVGDATGGPLSVSHDVGIFRVSDQSLLTSATVPAGSGGFLDSGFMYVSLSSSVLLTPDSYVIVMTMPSGNADTQSLDNTSVVTAPEIAYVNSEFDGGSSLAFPNPGFESSFAIGMFGPNFQFTDATTVVPEAGGLTVLSLGLASIGAFNWMKRRKAKIAT